MEPQKKTRASLLAGFPTVGLVSNGDLGLSAFIIRRNMPRTWLSIDGEPRYTGSMTARSLDP
jgi:hypothetical protein